MLRSHLTVLEESASVFSDSVAFKLPLLDPSTERIVEWSSISYRQFWLDVQSYARHWSHIFRSAGISPRSVVGLWLNGMTYYDVLHIYGISRAGYTPQLFSLRLPNPDVIYELLHRADAKLLICDPTLRSILSNCPVPVFEASIPTDDSHYSGPLPSIYPTQPDATAFVFHTSGSTSGSPKLVPCSNRWVDCAVRKGHEIGRPKDNSRQDVSVWMGSMCHIGQTCMLIANIIYGSCTVQPTKVAFSSDEFVDMVLRCRLNRLTQFATFLSIHLRNSRLNPKLLSLLQNLDQILYSGLPLGREEEEWAFKNGMNITNLFGSTECGALMLSVGGSSSTARLLRPLDGTAYQFVAIDSNEAARETEHQSSSPMLELVVLSESGDCPDVHLRSTEDGHFHTGDLFQEVSHGLYAPRGRNDDWIKSENSLRCDTRAIEDNVRATCAHLIEECIVVGTGRPSPVLFIEVPSSVSPLDHTKVKKEIIRRIRPFHQRLYLHERITNVKMIIVVPSKTLPRTATKGNIRRKAVEEAYKKELDCVFASS